MYGFMSSILLMRYLDTPGCVIEVRDGTGADNQRRDQNKTFPNSPSKSGLCESENLGFLAGTLFSLWHSDHPERSNPNSL